MRQGGGANSSNRYGDYASMSVDPLNDSFWFTGEYNPTSQWTTWISNFDFATCNCTSGTNTWVGPATGEWNEDASYWSLGEFPDYCQDIVIPAGFTITIKDGQTAKGFTLDVQSGASVETESGGLMDIVAPD